MIFIFHTNDTRSFLAILHNKRPLPRRERSQTVDKPMLSSLDMHGESAREDNQSPLAFDLYGYLIKTKQSLRPELVPTKRRLARILPERFRDFYQVSVLPRALQNDHDVAVA